MTPSGFALHGIDHLSASSINTYAAAPALWVMERLLKRWTPAGAAAARGQAAELGINHGLVNPNATLEECQKVAQADFQRRTMLLGDHRVDSERSDLDGYVDEGLKHLRLYGVPSGYQEKIEVAIDGVDVPFHGFIDWNFADHGMIVDGKTSGVHPSAIKQDHGRQAAIYQQAYGNHEIRFAYIKPRPGKAKDAEAVRVYRLEAEEYQQHLAAIRQIAQRMERFLRLSADAAELAGYLCPNYEDFRWNNPNARAHGVATFGW